MLGVFIAILLSFSLFLGNAGWALAARANGNAFTDHTYSFGTTADGFNSNQLKSYNRPDTGETVELSYDADGSRASRVVKDASNVVLSTDTFTWDQDNRLIALNLNSGPPASQGEYTYLYDARTRRVLRDESGADGDTTRITYLGGTSIAETTVGTATPNVEYIRANGMGGGIGSILYSQRGGTLSTSHYNSRGDVVARTNSLGIFTYTAAYEAFGTHESETGANPDRQQANTKEEDPTGLLNEGFRYRDLETGMFISRDPAGFVDGPNVYTYVQQNPWTAFDPLGLAKYHWKEGGWLRSMGDTVSEGASHLANEATRGNTNIAISVMAGVVEATGNGISAVSNIGNFKGMKDGIVNSGEKVGKVGVNAKAQGDSGPIIASKMFLTAVGNVTGGSGVYEGYSGKELGTGRSLSNTERVEVGFGGLSQMAAMGASLSKVNQVAPSARANAPKKTLYHYTDDAGLDGITSSQKLNPSLKANNPNDVRYGNGQYLSDIAPGTKTNAQLSREFLNMPFQGKKFKNYVEIDVTDLPVKKVRDGVFVVPNETPLDLTGRIINSGSN